MSWIHEGTAEYMRVIAPREFRGIPTPANKLIVLGGLGSPMPLVTLFSSSPNSQNQKSFYNTAMYFVGFLMIKADASHFHAFLVDMAGGMSEKAALTKDYGFPNVAAAQAEFTIFSR